MAFPSEVEKLIQQNQELHSAILSTFARFEPWFTSSGTPFFPEYTDHSDRHVRDVLKTAISLVRDEAFPVITPSDAAILALACLLHDSAMHLTEQGFKTLTEDPLWPLLPYDSQPWPLMWEEFISEASRFGGGKLVSLFGNQEPIRRPPENIADWTLKDRLLIGEFLRRHHARLAHEIAVSGVPGPGTDRLRISGFPEDLADLSGIVARSHGTSLRSALRYLDAYDLRQYKGVHAPFLMALLRVADYLQLQAERAPKELLKVKKLLSPFSEGEWRVHAAVIDIRNTHSDPEAIFVQAAPEDVQTYLKLKRLLQGLQSELDSCWAVLGEVYGRFGKLAELGLTLRRIRSNLDDREEFQSTVNYIPVDAKFDAAGAELLKLLIKPLYGEKPGVGIRELLQNAVDACLERKDLALKEDIDRDEDEADVEIELCETDGEKIIIVSDHGIGMTTSTVLNYFLRAGASFRYSDAWRQQHETESGKSRVLRSGRFGIGALAAFLLGDVIEVWTRHIFAEPQQGIHFRATLETENIQLEHVTFSAGTTISIRVTDDEIWSNLSRVCYSQARSDQSPMYPGDPGWDWYCLQVPRVIRQLTANGQSRICLQQLTVPTSGDQIEMPWHRLQVSQYLDVQWVYDRKLPELICNGIFVERRMYYAQDTTGFGDGMKVLKPTVSVFDPDGHLPLNLQRTGLAVPNLPFKDELLESQCLDYIAWCIASAPIRVPTDNEIPKNAFVRCELPLQPFGFTNKGSVISDKSLFRLCSPKSTFFCTAQSFNSLSLALEDDELWMPISLEAYASDNTKAWFRFVLSAWGWRDSFKPFSGIPSAGRQSILKTILYRELKAPRIIARDLWLPVNERPSNETWSVFTVGNVGTARLNLQSYLNTNASAGFDGITEFSSAPGMAVEPIASKDQTVLARVWSELTDEIVIPYDLEERRRRLAHIYNKLGPMIEYHSKQLDKLTDEVEE